MRPDVVSTTFVLAVVAVVLAVLAYVKDPGASMWYPAWPSPYWPAGS